jgi:hypothetical protein
MDLIKEVETREELYLEIQNGDIKMEAITVEKEPSYLTKVL